MRLIAQRTAVLFQLILALLSAGLIGTGLWMFATWLARFPQP
jgi:hypothetical protein